MPLSPPLPSVTLLHVLSWEKKKWTKIDSPSWEEGQGLIIEGFIQVSGLYDFC